MPRSIYNKSVNAGVMELADVPDSKSGGGDTVRVRPPPPAPNQHNPNPRPVGPYPVGDGFGFVFYFEPYEVTHFRNGVVKRVTSKPRGPKKKKGKGVIILLWMIMVFRKLLCHRRCRLQYALPDGILFRALAGKTPCGGAALRRMLHHARRFGFCIKRRGGAAGPAGAEGIWYG